MTKNEILQAFDSLGFQTEELGNGFYHFEFEEINFLYVTNEDDEDFLSISIPSIFEVTEENMAMIMPILNRTNNIIKYAKLVYLYDTVWATFEYPIFEGVDIENVLELAIRLLQGAVFTFNKVLRGDFEENEEKN